tara:strand:+ start:1584 stop:2234 length:651 start_codon:yes stop_codon:yes gene_type:complete
METISHVLFYTGLFPVQMYTMVGLLMAIIEFLMNKTSGGLRFFIVPQLLTYSLIGLIKTPLERYGMNDYFFPSGQSAVAFSLASALFCEMNYCKTPELFNFSIENSYAQVIVSFVGFAVASMGSIYSIIGGQYEKSVLDVITGALFGTLIGFISWYNIAKSQDKLKDDFFISEKIMNALRTIVVVIIVVLILEYLFNTARNIDSIEDSGYHIEDDE